MSDHLGPTLADADAPRHDDGPRRPRRGWLGRRALDVVAILVVGTMLVSAMPPSTITEVAQPIERPITDVTGLSQNWALFAPSPRSTYLRLRAEIERADGTVTEWTPPVGDRFIGVYRTYRWRKWANGVVVRDAGRLQRGAASYLEAVFADEGDAPIVEIRLYRGEFRQEPPGSGIPADRDPVFDEELIHTATIAPDDEVTR